MYSAFGVDHGDEVAKGLRMPKMAGKKPKSRAVGEPYVPPWEAAAKPTALNGGPRRLLPGQSYRDPSKPTIGDSRLVGLTPRTQSRKRNLGPTRTEVKRPWEMR